MATIERIAPLWAVGLLFGCEPTPPAAGCETTSRFYDRDGDGYGDPTRLEQRCIDDADWVDNNQDCDDGDRSLHPDAAEICNGRDDDCDGVVDDDDPDWDRSGGVETFLDLDGDGFYDAAGAAQMRCPSDAPLVAGDCDDSQAAANPDAEERCGDGIDNDCDGVASSCVLPDEVDDASVQLNHRTLGVGAGLALGLADLDRDGRDDLLIGAPHDNAGGKGAGAVLMRNGAALGADTAEMTAGVQIFGDQADGLGATIATGDFDGDTIADVLIGSSEGEAAWMVSGLDFPTLGVHLIDDVAAGVVQSEAFLGFGREVINAGDLDGDGIDEFFIGESSGAAGAGAVHLFYGGDQDWTAPLAPASAAAAFLGTEANERIAVRGDAQADYDGDGVKELVLTARNHDDGVGRIDVFKGAGGRYNGEIRAADADSVLRSETGGYLGGSVATLGDWNRDGYTDLAAGAYFDDEGGEDAGAVHVFYGDALGWSATKTAPLVIVGETAGGSFGSAVSGPGDLDADGIDDAVFGEAGYGVDSGALYVFFGREGTPTGVLSITQHSHRIVGTVDYARLAHRGARVISGDVNGDGFTDVMAGAHGADEVMIFYTGGL
ncbi:MAG: MopE-related protein [Myxococcota bacterium]